jgi:hypothetical protein
MAQELIKLRRTSNLTEERSEIIDKEFDGFQKLFGNFLAAESQVTTGANIIKFSIVIFQLFD